MSRYRKQLPMQGNTLFLTDGGLETTLVFLDSMDLPGFAAFPLLDDVQGRARLERYYRDYLDLAQAAGRGFVLEAPTWRANADWGIALGYDAKRLTAVNRRAIDLLVELREIYDRPQSPVVISGNIGPRGDGYRVDTRMTPKEAQDYHDAQIRVFADTAADLVSAFTINYTEEAVGITLAASAHAIPVVLSFTVETDGRLPSGEGLAEAIRRTDDLTAGYPVYYMINCAHPSHFDHLFGDPDFPAARIQGLRANASRRSHAELDACTDLDAGNPTELGHQYQSLRTKMPALQVLGGCCGTDLRHLEAISRACA